MLPRNTHLRPPSGEGPWPTVEPVPPSYQPEEGLQSIRDLHQGPVRTGHCQAPPREQLLRMAMLMPDTLATWGKHFPAVRLCREGRAEEAAMRPPPAPAGAGAGVRCTTAVADDPQRRASEGSPGLGHGAPTRQITAVRL